MGFEPDFPYSKHWVLRILDVKIIGTGIFLGHRVDRNDVRPIKDRTIYIEFRLYGYYPVILERGPRPCPDPFSRIDFKKILGMPRIDPMVMTVISMTHWDPMGMGMWHNCELNAYAHVYRYSNMYYHQFLELSTKIQFANLAKYAGRPSAPCPQADQMESITRFTLQVPYSGCV